MTYYLIDGILYVICFLAILYYLLHWTNTNKQLQHYINTEKQKIKANWSAYTAGGSFYDGLTKKEPFTDLGDAEQQLTASKSNCSQWTTSSSKLGAYNDTETNMFASTDNIINNKIDGSNINLQQLLNDNNIAYRKIYAELFNKYIAVLDEYLAQQTAGKTNLDIIKIVPPAITILFSSAGMQIPDITAWLSQPLILDIITPEQKTELLTKYPAEPWLRVYTQIQVIKRAFADNLEARLSQNKSLASAELMTYLQIANIDYAKGQLNSDDIPGSSYYPADRKYLNKEAQRRLKLTLDTDKLELSAEDYNAKWSWINKLGKPLTIPDGFGINTPADTIKDVQTRSVMDILTDYDPNQFGCQRIYQECGTRQAPGFNLDAYNYDKYDTYLNSLATSTSK